MSFNFLKNLVKVKAGDLEESMVNLATTLDTNAVLETSILQKMDEQNQRIALLQEANADYRKEQQEYERELALYNRYLNEAEQIQKLLDMPVLDAQYTREELTSDLNDILSHIETHLPILEKEKAEAEQAKVWMDEMQLAVDEISKELLTLRESVNSIKKEIQQAELEKDRNRKRAEQAEVLAGLKKSGNKFDVALNALKNKAESEKAEAEKLKIKAESLKVTKPAVPSVIGKYSPPDKPVSTESASDRLARLKAKV